MRNLKPSDVNKDYEPDWKTTSFGSAHIIESFSGLDLSMCCEKCVFNSGEHASFCETLKLKEINDE